MWLDDVALQAHRVLLQEACAGPARVYLRSRGVSDRQVLKFKIGFWDAPPALTVSTPEFWDFSRKYGYGRITFPLTDGLGGTIGMQVRALDRNRGYQNFSLEPKELNPLTFGLAQALPLTFQSGRIVLVEGVFDCLAVEPYAADCIATLTSNVSLRVRRLLSRYASLAICLFDSDAAGRRGAHRLAGIPVPEEFRQPSDVTREKPYPAPCSVVLPSYSEHDPSDLVAAGKIDELKRLVMAQPVVTRFAQLT